MRTVTVRRGEDGFAGKEGEMAMSGRETTAREPRDIGCSGSEIVETRSIYIPISICIQRQEGGG